jgi:tripartite motif-containing protein 71
MLFQRYRKAKDDALSKVQSICQNQIYFDTSWESFGTNEGEFNGTASVALHSSGNVYVDDQSNNRIQKFTSNGEYITEWGSRGQGKGQFDFPIDVAVDTSGNVYVVGSNNNSIQKFVTNNGPGD